MRIKVFLTLCWIAPYGTLRGGYAGHMLPPSPSRRSSLWCSAGRLSHCAIASPRPASAPHGRAPEKPCGSAPSPRESVPCPAAFFRLARPQHPRLVPLEPAVLQQGGLAREADPLTLRHLLVVRLPRIGAAEAADALAAGVDDDDVLVTVGFLLAAVVQPL